MSTEAGKFVKESYDNNNDFAIKIVETFLKNKGYSITEKEEDYKVDIIATKNNEEKLFEVEVKTGYSFTDINSYRFPTVSFLARKKKWNINKGFLYIIVCKETNWALVAQSSDIYKDEYKENLTINTQHRKGKDEFYRVPKEKCKFFKIR